VAVNTEHGSCLRRLRAKDLALSAGSWELLDVSAEGLIVASYSSPVTRPALFVARFNGEIPAGQDGFIYLDWKPLLYSDSPAPKPDPWHFSLLTFRRKDAIGTVDFFL
jgi:hypothetical protein